MRVYYSTYHLWAADSFATQTAERETELTPLAPTFDIKHRALATSAVISAAAFLEAAINETLKDAADRHGSYVGHLDEDVLAALAELWEDAEETGPPFVSVLEKFQSCLEAAELETFDRGALPFQDAQLLIKLRNHLVHFKPATRAARDLNRLERQLRPRFAENALIDTPGNPYFPDKCLGAGCARWAVATVRALADEFFRRLDVVPNYQRVEHEPTDPNN